MTPAPSFARDIRPMFRDTDVESMKDFGDFDLSKYEDVRARARDIYDAVSEGSMPCDQRWPADQVQKFKAWMDGGMAP